MNNNRRRLQYFEVCGNVLFDVMRGGIFYFDSVLPEDTEYVTTHYDCHRDVFLVLARSSSFEEVIEGYSIPILGAAGLIMRLVE